VKDSLGTVVEAALTMRDELRDGGLAGPELDAALEHVLRDTWPKPKDRTEPWHDGCANCRDYGLEMLWCPGDATCGPNPVTKKARPKHGPHEYGKPCWCPKGLAFSDKQTPTPDDAMTIAAKRKPMSRCGR
jgi:hypothetical protein